MSNSSKILIVEDEVNIRETLYELLQLAGYIVVMAEDGEIASELIIQEKPDIVLCDVNLPKRDGFSILEKAKEDLLEDLVPPFIFLTARVDHDDIRKGMDLGAADYITKPLIIKM